MGEHVTWKVMVGDKVVEEEDNPRHLRITIDELVGEIRHRWGVNCDIDIHFWRGNWQA